MKERPILFSTEMVKAIQEGRKTMTRRIINPQPNKDCYYIVEPDTRNGLIGVLYDYNQGDQNPFIKSTWQIGDLLWVRESFSPWSMHQGDKLISSGVYYKANFPPDHLKCKPSIFMPKSAARIWLEVTGLNFQRLQNITERDVIKEGVRYYEDPIIGTRFKDYLADASGYGHPEEDYPTVTDPIESFKSLWQSINGLESWDDNPLIWVIEFKVLSTTGKPPMHQHQPNIHEIQNI